MLALVLAAFYGMLLSQIPSDSFKDFANYLVYAEHSWPRLLNLLDQGPLVVLANEPVWLLINSALATVLRPESVVRVIIFSSATLVAWFVLTRGPRHFIWLVAFLLFPMVIKNHLVHLRQGAAIALFLWGWFSPSRGPRWLLMGLTPFVHASFAFVLPILWAARLMTEARLAMDVRTAFFVAIGVATGLSLGWLAVAIGARQGAAYSFSMPDVSGLGFVFWLGVFSVMVMEGRHFLREHAFETGLMLFYLSTYWLIEVTGRIYESGLLLVLLAGLALTGWRQRGFLFAILIFAIHIWFMRAPEPAFGFGIG